MPLNLIDAGDMPIEDSMPLQAIAEAIEESLPFYLQELELISTAVDVAFDRLKQATVTLLKGITPENQTFRKAAATALLTYVV